MNDNIPATTQFTVKVDRQANVNIANFNLNG